MAHNPYAPPRTKVGDIEPPVSFDRPRSVVIAVQLLWASFGVGVLGSAIDVFMRHTGTALAAALVGMLVADGINFAISYWLYTAAWRGRGWSRVVQAALMVVHLAANYLLRSLGPDFLQLSPFLNLIYLIANFTEIVGIVFLFTPTAHAWFRAMRAQRQVLRR